MTGHRKRVIRSAEEQDTHTVWRRYLSAFQRAGLAKKGKTRTNRRERREARDDITEQRDDT